jgi:hypothetical protein
MGQHQHICSRRVSASRGRCLRRRVCLRKGCGCVFQPRRWNQRYCQDAECLPRRAGVGRRPNGSGSVVKTPTTASGIVRHSDSDESSAESRPLTQPDVSLRPRSRPSPSKRTARGHAAKAQRQIFAIAPGATILLAVRIEPWRVIAMSSAARRCGVYAIVSVSGCVAIPTWVASSGNWNMNTRAAGVPASQLLFAGRDRPAVVMPNHAVLSYWYW